TGYSWDFKDGNSSDESDPSHTFETAGTYEVSLTVTDAEGLKSTETVSIIVEAKENVAPVAKLSANKTSGTLPLAVSFTGSGSTDDTGITGYSWDFKDGNSSEQSDATHTFESDGIYEVELTVTDAEGLTNTETVSITVESKENTAPVAKASADKTSGTLPLAVAFTGSGSTDDTGVTAYSWDFKDGNGSEQSDATHTFETAGIYEVSLTVTDEEGLTSTSSLSINVIEAEVIGPLDCSTGGKTAGESGNKVWCWGDIAFPTWSGSSGVSFSDKQLYIDSQCDEQQVTKSGNRLKFSVNPNSPNVANWCSEDYNIRAEVRTEPWNVRHPKGTEEWFGWSYSFGNNYVIDENNEWLFFQVHPGISGKSPHTELMVNREGQYGGKAGEIYIVNHVNYPDYIATGIIPKAGETIDVVVHAIWGDSSNGLLEVWINGQKFYNKQTKTIYDSHPWGGNAKWGIYKWPWRDGDKVQKSVEQGASQLETYLGTVRMITRKPGDTDYGKDSYSMVAPN
nr:PKD domain-containing protein [Zobellia laminariae]